MAVKLILLGAPGAGKGTQAAELSKRLNIPAISTGNILRQAIQEGTGAGLQVKALIDAGKFAPDDFVMQILSERLTKSDCQNGYVLDGVPRTLAQAKALDRAGIVFDHVISLEVPDKDIEERMGGRRVCSVCGATYHIQTIPPKQEGICDSCGGALILRADDTPETVRNRLEVYHAQTEPLKDYYGKQGLLRQVSGNGTIDSVAAEIMEVVGL